jgi:hypothetical protein
MMFAQANRGTANEIWQVARQQSRACLAESRPAASQDATADDGGLFDN